MSSFLSFVIAHLRFSSNFWLSTLLGFQPNEPSFFSFENLPTYSPIELKSNVVQSKSLKKLVKFDGDDRTDMVA